MVREARWEDYNIGDEFGPLEYRVTPELVQSFGNAVDDCNSSTGSTSFGAVAPPTLLALDYFPLVSNKLGIMGKGLHAKHESEFLNPLKVGKKVTVKGRIIDKYEKRGRRFFILEYLAIDEDGLEISRHRFINTMGY